MKTLLAACVTFGVLTAAALPQAHADVRIGAPGVRLDIGPQEQDWRHRHWAHRDWGHRDWERRDWAHREWEHRHWQAYRERCYYRGC
jgi:hypothetical protein